MPIDEEIVTFERRFGDFRSKSQQNWLILWEKKQENAIRKFLLCTNNKNIETQNRKKYYAKPIENNVDGNMRKKSRTTQSVKFIKLHGYDMNGQKKANRFKSNPLTIDSELFAVQRWLHRLVNIVRLNKARRNRPTENE